MTVSDSHFHRVCMHAWCSMHECELLSATCTLHIQIPCFAIFQPVHVQAKQATIQARQTSEAEVIGTE